MPRGGYREGGGRPKGSPNKGTELGRKTVDDPPKIAGRYTKAVLCLK